MVRRQQVPAPSIDLDAEFVLSSVNGDIILTYYAVPIPEPSTLAFWAWLERESC